MTESEQPLVSVIIPVYNGEHFLAEAIASVRAQNYAPLEIIIVDDGSTDGTSEVAQKLGDDIRYVYQANAGPAAARNRGLELARGELIAFLDADDLWLPDKLDRQVQLLQVHHRLGYVGCRVQPQLIFGQEWPTIFRRAYWESQPPTFTSSALLIRRAIWEQVGPFDTNRKLGEDADWVMRARDLGIEAIAAAETLLVKRIHDQNLSYQAEEMGRDLVIALQASLRRKKCR